MKKFFALLAIASPFVLVFSCRHEPILPEQQVSFATDILPIIQSNCQQSGCHGTVNEEFKLTTYENIMDKGEIVAGKPHSSELYQVIEDGTMPPNNSPRVSDRNQKLIYIWIAQGAKNN